MAEPKRYNQRSNPPHYSYRSYFTPEHRRKLPNAKQNEQPSNQSNIGHSGLENTPTKKKWQLPTADRISVVSVFVSAVLAWFTYGLYSTASYDSKIADTSANSAKMSAIIAGKTLEATRSYDSASLVKQQQALDNSLASSKAQFKNDTTALGTQIEQFKIENEPYLQIGEFTNVKIKGDSAISFYYKIFNLGKQPVKETFGNERVDYVLAPQEDDFIKHPFKKLGKLQKVGGDYFTSGNPTLRIFLGGSNFPVTNEVLFKNGAMSVYFVGKYDYLNVVNNKIREYKFVIRFTYINGVILSKYYLSDNRNIK